MNATTIPAGMMMDMENFEGGKYAKLAYTPEEAARITGMFREIGGFTVSAEQIGDSCYGPRGFEVWLRQVNLAAGNRNAFRVPLESGIDMKRAKQIAKEAKAKFSGRDKAALRRIATEREMDKE